MWYGEPATIQLEQGELKLTDAVAITGPGPTLLTIDARQQSRIFNITARRGDFVINGLTLTNGRVSETDGDPSGGAIRSTTRGMLAIGKVTISNSSAVSNGGAIFARDVTITSSTISGNSAGDFVITPRNLRTEREAVFQHTCPHSSSAERRSHVLPIT